METSAYVLHHLATEQVDLHESNVRSGNLAEARAALRSALTLELAAAWLLPVEVQPARAVLFRSAGSLAYLCARPDIGHIAVYEGLRGRPHPEIVVELQELLANYPEPSVAFERAVDDSDSAPILPNC